MCKCICKTASARFSIFSIFSIVSRENLIVFIELTFTVIDPCMKPGCIVEHVLS